MARSSPPRPRRPRRGRRKPNADLLRQIGEELATFRDGPPEGTFDFGDPVEISEISRRERMVRMLWAEALDGDLKAMQMILDYTDGRPVQAMEVKASVRFTSDEYAQAEKRLAAWRESMAAASQREGLAPQPEGLAPLPEGLAPLPEGLAPQPEGLAPLPEEGEGGPCDGPYGEKADDGQ